MKRVLIVLLVGIAMLSMLCVGVALGLTFTPVRAQVARVIDRVAQRADIHLIPRLAGTSDEGTPGSSGANAQTDNGILVAGVISNSPAEQAGLRRGDILLMVNNQAVNTLPDLVQAFGSLKAGDRVTLGVQRGDTSVTLTATTGDAAGQQQFGPFHGSLLGIIPCTDADMMRGFDNMPQFEQRVGTGAQITEIASGSPAEQAGLQTGEWIVAVDGTPVVLPNQVTRIIQQHKPGDQLLLTIKDSSDQQRDVTVTLAVNPNPNNKVSQAWLGVTLSYTLDRIMPVPPTTPDQPNRDPGGPMVNPPSLPQGYAGGAAVVEVVAGGPAEKAGLQVGQVILAVDGQKLASADQLKSAIAAHQPGDRVRLTVIGPESTGIREVAITLGENPDTTGAAYLGIRYGFLESSPEAVPNGPVN